VKEEDRLAAVIADVCADVYIIPRGAYNKTPKGEVFNSRTFEGKKYSVEVERVPQISGMSGLLLG
jgi:hypothetical protein